MDCHLGILLTIINLAVVFLPLLAELGYLPERLLCEFREQRNFGLWPLLILTECIIYLPSSHRLAEFLKYTQVKT